MGADRLSRYKNEEEPINVGTGGGVGYIPARDTKVDGASISILLLF
jgi:hypothetical protein